MFGRKLQSLAEERADIFDAGGTVAVELICKSYEVEACRELNSDAMRTMKGSRNGARHVTFLGLGFEAFLSGKKSCAQRSYHLCACTDLSASLPARLTKTKKRMRA